MRTGVDASGDDLVRVHEHRILNAGMRTGVIAGGEVQVNSRPPSDWRPE